GQKRFGSEMRASRSLIRSERCLMAYPCHNIAAILQKCYTPSKCEASNSTWDGLSATRCAWTKRQPSDSDGYWKSRELTCRSSVHCSRRPSRATERWTPLDRARDRITGAG